MWNQLFFFAGRIFDGEPEPLRWKNALAAGVTGQTGLNRFSSQSLFLLEGLGRPCFHRLILEWRYKVRERR